MKPFLEKLIIARHDGDQRIVDFRAGVTVVTGVGSKGKSSILKIVEYCLGSAQCNVPVGIVREVASWYFLVLNVHGETVMLGRRAADEVGGPSEDAYFGEVKTTLPDDIASRIVLIGTACRALGKLLRVPDVRFGLGDDSAPIHGAVEVKDILPLLLQPQDTIATERLFIGTTERNKWVNTIKLALEITDAKLIAWRHRRDLLQKQKKALKQQQVNAEKEQREGEERLEILRRQAVTAGLLGDGKFATTQALQGALRQVQNHPSVNQPVPMADDEEIVALEVQSREYRKTIEQIDVELKDIRRLRTAAKNANESLRMQKSRVRVANLLGTPTHAPFPCPLCGATEGMHEGTVLQEMQEQLDQELTFVETIPPDLDARREELLSQREKMRNQLESIERRLEELNKSKVAPTMTDQRIQRERLIGEIQGTLRWTPPLRTLDFAERIASLDAEIRDIEKQIEDDREETHEKNIRGRLTSGMKAAADELERLQISNGELRFDDAFTTLQLVRGNRQIPMAQLGGGENFVMYHLCAFLALHGELLAPNGELREQHGFVPPLLILDQPSQAYFQSTGNTAKIDEKAVLDLYDLLFKWVGGLKDRLQIIVLDHADFSTQDERFARAALHRWHGEEGLILESKQNVADLP